MIFGYLNLVFEILAHIFRALVACVIILPVAGFLSYVALDRFDGLTMLLGLMAAGMAAIMAAALVFMELVEAVEEVHAFRHWRAAIQKM